MLFDACCFGVCRKRFVICRVMPFVVCCSLCFVCCLLMCCDLCIVCCLLFVSSWLSNVRCRLWVACCWLCVV